MEEFLNNLLSESSVPVWSAFLLGLITAISPCPLATNITAMGFISRDLTSRRRVFYNGLVYTFGRAFSYTLLAVILFLGADIASIRPFFEQYGERILGPLLVVIGIFMLGIIKLKLPAFNKYSQKFRDKSSHTYRDVFLLGVVFALAFCPNSAVLYFLLLIPMTIQSASGLYLPVVYAIATGIPVIVFAWLLAFTVSGVGKFYNRLSLFDYWFRRVIAIAFIATGLYFIFILWF